MGRSLAILVFVSCVVACSDDIAMPAPKDLAAKQIGYGVRGTIELRWRLVVRVDRYIVHYGVGDVGKDLVPEGGVGLSVVDWSGGCGEFDAGAVKTFAAAFEAGAPRGDGASHGASDRSVTDGRADATSDGAIADGQIADAAPRDVARPADLQGDVIGKGKAADSPIVIPAISCLEVRQSFTDAGATPVRTPGRAPRIRLQNLIVGRTYRFAVASGRRAARSPLSEPVSITVAVAAR